MPDINNIIKELDGLILSIISDGTNLKTEKRVGLIGIDVSINISPLVLPQDSYGNSRQLKEEVEPLIDVIGG